MNMKKLPLALGAILMVNAVAVNASSMKKISIPDQYKQEVGLGVGLVVGALVAGPAGAILGAIGGAAVADNDRSQDKNLALLNQLKHNQAAQVNLKAQIDALETANAEFQKKNSNLTASLDNVNIEPIYNNEVGRGELLQAITEGMSFNVLFRAGSSNIEPQYQSQIQSLAKSLEKIDELSIYLKGFSDPAGDEEKNMALSKKRVEAIKAVLIENGVAAEKISEHAYGESEVVSDENDIKGFPFERRVRIILQMVKVSS